MQNNYYIQRYKNAIIENDLDLAKTLIIQGVDPNTPIYDDWLAHHLACRDGNLDFLLFLEKHKAKLDAFCQTDMGEANGLSIAIWNKNFDIAQYLIDKNINANDLVYNGISPSTLLKQFNKTIFNGKIIDSNLIDGIYLHQANCLEALTVKLGFCPNEKIIQSLVNLDQIQQIDKAQILIESIANLSQESQNLTNVKNLVNNPYLSKALLNLTILESMVGKINFQTNNKRKFNI